MAAKLEMAHVLEWLSGFEAAREADHARFRQEPVDFQRSIRLALDLMICIRRRGGQSIEEMGIREEAVEQVRQRWVALKIRASH